MMTRAPKAVISSSPFEARGRLGVRLRQIVRVAIDPRGGAEPKRALELPGELQRR